MILLRCPDQRVFPAWVASVKPVLFHDVSIVCFLRCSRRLAISSSLTSSSHAADPPAQRDAHIFTRCFLLCFPFSFTFHASQLPSSSLSHISHFQPSVEHLVSSVPKPCFPTVLPQRSRRLPSGVASARSRRPLPRSELANVIPLPLALMVVVETMTISLTCQFTCNTPCFPSLLPLLFSFDLDIAHYLAWTT